MMRTGTGFDVHRLAEGEELWLCGLRIEHDKGLCRTQRCRCRPACRRRRHAGRGGAGDIGEHFPPSDPQWKGAPSAQLRRPCRRPGGTMPVMRWAMSTSRLICEAPKIGPHREAMRGKLAELLGVDRSQVSMKATTTERLGFTGTRRRNCRASDRNALFAREPRTNDDQNIRSGRCWHRSPWPLRRARRLPPRRHVF